MKDPNYIYPSEIGEEAFLDMVCRRGMPYEDKYVDGNNWYKKTFDQHSLIMRWSLQDDCIRTPRLNHDGIVGLGWEERDRTHMRGEHIRYSLNKSRLYFEIGSPNICIVVNNLVDHPIFLNTPTAYDLQAEMNSLGIKNEKEVGDDSK